MVGAVGTDICHYHLVDGTGKHEAAVIVSVLADEVETSWSHEQHAVASIKLGEFLLDFFFHDEECYFR